MKIAGKKLPENASRLVQNMALMAVFYNFLEGQMATENLDFITDLRSGKKPKDLYDTYVALKAPNKINVADATRKPMIELATAKNWDKKAWKTPLSKASNELLGLLEGNFLHSASGGFYLSDQFNGYVLSKLKLNAKKAAKLLGTKRVAQMNPILIAVGTDNTAKAKRLITAVMKKDLKKNPESKDVDTKFEMLKKKAY